MTRERSATRAPRAIPVTRKPERGVRALPASRGSTRAPHDASAPGLGSGERLVATLQRARAAGRGLLSVYLPAGFPDLARSRQAFEDVASGGADFIEVGIPFSDPVADGPALQEAAARVLKSGGKVRDAFALAKAVRTRHPDLPLVAMTYANLAQRHGWARFAEALRGAGIDGLVVPDVPLEESGPLREALSGAGLAHVPLVTPTTGAKRMKAIAATATGFLYVVTNVGVTGQSDPGPLVAQTVARARKAAPAVPLGVGFGVRTAHDVARLREAGADAVIVGSQIVRALGEGADLRLLVATLRAGLEP